MAMIDDKGRLLGRFNLVDAAFLLLFFAAIPAAYGSYLLFREPPPKLTEALPTTLGQGPNLQIEVRGENFRPYMRVSFGDAQGRNFLFNNPGSAVVQLPDLPPGKYDLVLVRLHARSLETSGAITIIPPPRPRLITVTATGVFVGLKSDVAAKLEPGFRFGGEADTQASILSRAAPESEVGPCSRR